MTTVLNLFVEGGYLNFHINGPEDNSGIDKREFFDKFSSKHNL